jgi:hypothetical protein
MKEGNGGRWLPRNVLSQRAILDSERPAPPPRERHITRPFYLVAAMVLLWILGVQGFLSGVTIASMLHSGALPDVDRVARSAAAGTELRVLVLADAQAVALGAVPHLSFPLSVAKLLLAGALVLAATLVLVGRPSARTFALQAICANAVFAVIEYVALRQVRGAWIDIMIRVAPAMHDDALSSPEAVAGFCFWIERVRLVGAELGIPLLGAIALTRPRTKTYFAEAAAAAEGAEEEP